MCRELQRHSSKLRAVEYHRRLLTIAPAAICAFFHVLPILAAAHGPSSAEPKVQLPQTTIRTNVRRVIVDAVVTDSKGKPVRGLSEQDFSVYEDGTPQEILSFDSHSSVSDTEFVPHRLPALPANWFVNLPSGPERGPLFVVLLDLVHTEIEDQPRARKQLQDFIGSKPEGARFAIFALTDTLHLVQGFTEDRDRLLAAVSPQSNQLLKIFIYADNFRPYVSGLGALIDIGRFLSGFPGRKNLIWISGDFPYFILLRTITGAGATSSTPVGMSSGSTLVEDEFRAAIDTLARAQVAVYPVDARGLVARALVGSGEGQALNGSHSLEDSIAEETGGRAFYNDNDVEGFIAGVADTGADYYELTYSPTNLDDDGKLRHIKVEISRHGYHLAYRRSYSLRALDEPLPTGSRKERELLAQPGVIQPDDSLYIHMQHGAPIAHDLVFSAHVQPAGSPYRPTADQVLALAEQPAYFKGTNKKPDRWLLSKISLQAYVVDFRIAAAQLERAPSAATGESRTLELALAAFGADGVMLNAAVQRADTTSPSAQTQGPRVLTVRERIDVPTDAAWLRFAIRDNSTGRIGATEIALPLALEARR